MGGAWRQAGYIAAAGLYALQNNIGRLQEDHDKAKIVAAVLEGLDYVDEVYPCETNIFDFLRNFPIRIRTKNILRS